MYHLYVKILRAINKEKWLWGFKPSLSMFVTCWIFLTSSIILWISKVVISADFYSLARSHQNDFPSWKQLGMSFAENLNCLLISHVGIYLKFSFWILNFFKIRYWCYFRNKTKGGNLPSVTLNFLCNVLPSTASDQVSCGIPEEHQLHCVAKS